MTAESRALGLSAVPCRADLQLHVFPSARFTEKSYLSQPQSRWRPEHYVALAPPPIATVSHPWTYNGRCVDGHGMSSPSVYGYLRVSTEEQARSGLGLDAQRNELEREAVRRGWPSITYVMDDGYSARTLERPGLASMLATITLGDVLAVAKLDRLSRSVGDFVGLMARAQRDGWSLVVLDLALDTTTPMGEFVALTMANVAQLERRLIGKRTSDALQAAKARGQRLGIGNRVLDAELRARIVAEREAGESLRAIANRLNAEGVPTARGGARWHASTVHAAIDSDRLDREAFMTRTPSDRTSRGPC